MYSLCFSRVESTTDLNHQVLEELGDVRDLQSAEPLSNDLGSPLKVNLRFSGSLRCVGPIFQ